MDKIAPGVMLAADEEVARLRQALVWTSTILCVLVPLDIVLGSVLNSPAFYYSAGALSTILAAAGLSLALLRRGGLRGAALSLAGGVSVGTVLLTVAMPALTPSLTIAPALAIALLLPYLAPGQIRALSVVAVLLGVAVLLLGTQLPPVAPPPPAWLIAPYAALGVALALSVLMLLLWQNSTRLIGIIGQTRLANAELEAARSSLEATVASRTAALSSALAEVEERAAAQARLLEENDQQRSALREMSVPVLPVGAGAIVIPLVGALDSDRLQMLQHQALRAVAESRARHVLLDITGVPIIDTHVAQGLLSVVQSARLLGASVVLVGVRPEVAQTIVTLGIDMSGLVTRQSLQEGLAYTSRRR